MTKNRIQEPRPSTRAITVDEELARRMALFLFADQEPIIVALEGEPVKEALAMCEWCVMHEGDAGFDASKALPAWAKRRKRGRWSDRPTEAARIIWGDAPPRSDDPAPEETGDREIFRAVAGFWLKNPDALAATLDRMEAATNGNGR